MQFNADGTFESYFGERLQNGLQRVMEKHCGKETGAMADAITTCQKKHGSDPEAFSRCLEPPAIRFGQCVESAYVVSERESAAYHRVRRCRLTRARITHHRQTKLFGPMESHPKFEKIRHCITLGDGAPKKCWKIADQFLESTTTAPPRYRHASALSLSHTLCLSVASDP